MAGWGGNTFEHHQIRQNLSMALFQVAGQVGGQSLGRDFVMRLGENGFTPDLLFFKGQGHNRLFSYYLDGAAELVIEIVRPGHEYCDRILKRNFYEAAGVPEYWMLNSRNQQTEFLRLVEGRYQPQVPDSDGRYRPASVPGLAFATDTIWNEENLYQNWFDRSIFIVEAPISGHQRVRGGGGHEWGSLPFKPRLDLAPVPIRFEEYISWCPEAKFEFFEGKPQIGYKIGSQHLIGLLLMTFGLASAVQVLPLKAWIAALRHRLDLEQQDTQRKADWWKIARQAAELLREQFGLTRIGVIGDLVRPQPLNYWSEITLVSWDQDISEHWKIYEALLRLSRDPEINLLRAEKDYLRAEEKADMTQNLVEI
ncbi:Uma2 family endonuclease [Cyanobacteria bacterium FACHB-63]|nr:Uma2 family endonuclease [Cyanobacteria bacterium FACHB-63]